jgi:ATP-binding cassette subfamily B protein
MEHQPQKVTAQVVSTVWNHWKSSFAKSKYTIGGIVLFYSLSLYLELMFRPTQWKNVFDALVAGRSPWHAFTFVIWAAVIGWGMSRCGDACIAISESQVIKDLKDYAMKGLLGKSTHFFTTHSSGELVTKLKRFSHNSEAVIDAFVFSIIRSCLLVIYLVIFTSLLIPELAPAFLIWIVCFMAVTTILSRMRMKYDLISSNADSVTTKKVADNFLSIFTLRTNSAVPRVFHLFRKVTDDERIKRKTAWLCGNFQWALQGIFVVALELYCMKTIIGKVEDKAYSVGTVVMVQSYIASLSMYMWEFGRNLIKIRTAFADAYEMAVLLNEHSPEPVEHSDPQQVFADNSIAVSEVTFSYDDGVHTLKDFSFMFSGGRRYGIVGETGSGKSTLTKLILKAYDTLGGSIHVCDQNIEEVNRLSLRSWISYVPQDPQFPSWTIREIIAMGKPTADDHEIINAIQKASCDFVFEKPAGLDTLVGERGIKLSGGERQRLAIAAAILKDGPIVIMDEPTSALDARTERSIQDAIQTHFSGKTLIVIAHRLSTVAVLDEIILLRDGRVENCGSHDELLKTSDEYKDMWELQTQPNLV